MGPGIKASRSEEVDFGRRLLTCVWCNGTGGCGPLGTETAERGGGGNGAAESRDGSRAATCNPGGHTLRLSPRGPGAGLPRRPVWKALL